MTHVEDDHLPPIPLDLIYRAVVTDPCAPETRVPQPLPRRLRVSPQLRQPLPDPRPRGLFDLVELFRRLRVE